MTHRPAFVSMGIVMCLLSARPASCEIIPIKAQVNAGEVSTFSTDPAGQAISALGSFTSPDGNSKDRSVYGSYLNISDFDSGVFSYVESDFLENSSQKESGVIGNYGGYFYNFKTTSAYTLSMDYSFSGNSYFSGNFLKVYDLTDGSSQSFEFNSSPQLANLLLDANKEYAISTLLNASPSGPGKLTGANSGSISADFTYSVFFNFSSATPEPSAWLMMLIGVGLVGGLMRCQQDLRKALPEPGRR